MASAATPPFVGTAGPDRFIGSTLLNLFQFAPLTLEAVDSVAGSTNPAALDQVVLIAGGTVVAASWLGVTNVEALALSDVGNAVALSDALVAGSDAGFFRVHDGAGNSTVDASAVTAGRTVLFTGDAGSDRFVGGAGNDELQIAAANLSSADSFLAGAGGNWLTITGAGSVAAGAFANIKDVDILRVTDGASVALANGMFGDLAGAYGSSDNDTIDASAVSDRGITFLSGAGDDHLVGSSQNDFFHFAAASDLTAADVIAGGPGADTIVFYGGVAQADALRQVSSVQLVTLAGATQFTLLDTVAFGAIAVETSDGTDIVDGHLLSSNSVIICCNGGFDAIRGGNQFDTFWFRADTLDRDAVQGEGGYDFIVMGAPSNVTSADLQFVSSIEEFQLRAGGSVAVADAVVASARTSFQSHHMVLSGSSAVDALDASGVLISANSVTLRSGGGADILRGGAGSDVISVPDGSYAQVDGGGGFDILELGGDAFLDLSKVAAKTGNIEAIDLRLFGVSLLTLSAPSVAAVSGGANALYVVGYVEDEVDMGAGWTQVESGVTNQNFSATRFNHFTSQGVDLFLQDTFAGGALFPFETAEFALL